MDRQKVQSVLDQAYALRQKGDIEGIIALFHPECVFELVGARASSAVAGAVRGHQDFRRTLTDFIAAFEFVERDVISTVIEDRRAVVHSRVKLRFIPKDKTVTTDMLDLWTFENGKALELVEFVDTALINDLTQ
jgi:ketosteroid isomerase-like protein